MWELFGYSAEMSKWILVGLSILGLCAACIYAGYTKGYAVAETTVRDFENEKLRETIAQYEKRLSQEREQREAAAKSSSDRQLAVDELTADVAALRLQLNEAGAANDKLRAQLMDRSSSSCDIRGGRDHTLEKVLTRATDLIAERDRIAIDYNTLREQCSLKSKLPTN